MSCGKPVAFVAAIFGLLLMRSADASPLEPQGLNLGVTSFNDAVGANQPVFVYQQYVQYEHFNEITNAMGQPQGAPVFNKPNIQVETIIQQLSYVSPINILGGTLGLNAVQPVVNISSHFDQPSFVDLQSSGLGRGDLTWGPFIQFRPITLNGKPFLFQRIELSSIAPTGSYDKNKDLNPSSGFWSFNPYYAFTILPFENFEVSGRIHYLYNARNTHPAASRPEPIGDNFQAGQASWANFAASYKFFGHLDVGLNGFYFKQFTDDTVSGVRQPHSETALLDLGPGLEYSLDFHNFFYANAYLPIVKTNTVSGLRLIFHYTHVF